MTPEAKIVHNILQFANQYGKAIKLHGNEYQEHGTPDVVGGIRVLKYEGHYCYIRYFVETKVPGEYPTKIQAYRLKEWKDAGYITACVHSLEEFKYFLLWNRQYVDNIYPTYWQGMDDPIPTYWDWTDWDFKGGYDIWYP